MRSTSVTSASVPVGELGLEVECCSAGWVLGAEVALRPPPLLSVDGGIGWVGGGSVAFWSGFGYGIVGISDV